MSLDYERIDQLTNELVELLKTDIEEYSYDDDDMYQYAQPDGNADVARNICYTLLRCTNADGLCGCSLCQG